MDDKNSSVKQRILLFLKAMNISQKAFETKCGFSNGYVNNISKGIGAEKLQRILCEFPDLNRDWHIFGDGEMLRASVVQQGEGSNNQQGDGNVYNSDVAYNTLLKIVEASQRNSDSFIQVVKKSQEQTDKLLAMLQKLMEQS